MSLNVRTEFSLSSRLNIRMNLVFPKTILFFLLLSFLKTSSPCLRVKNKYNPCHYDDWGPWSACSLSCGPSGVQSRLKRASYLTRTMFRDECQGEVHETRSCHGGCIHGTTSGPNSSCVCYENFHGICCENYSGPPITTAAATTMDVTLGTLSPGYEIWPSDCGLRSTSTPSAVASGRRGGARIVGGIAVNAGDYPFVISVLKRVSSKWIQWCGATLVAGRVVIGAAHCFDPLEADFKVKYRFVAGDWDLVNETEGTEQYRNAVNISLHPNFDPDLLLNDIAVIYLDEAVVTTAYARPACLPFVRNDSLNYVAGERRLIAGWGRLSEGGPGTRVLRAVNVSLITNEDCVAWHREMNYDYSDEDITADMICAGSPEGGRDACQGDSGGPMVRDDLDGPFTMIGVVSWGVGCGGAKLPGVYTRVANYLGWLNETSQRMEMMDG